MHTAHISVNLVNPIHDVCGAQLSTQALKLKPRDLNTLAKVACEFSASPSTFPSYFIHANTYTSTAVEVDGIRTKAGRLSNQDGDWRIRRSWRFEAVGRTWIGKRCAFNEFALTFTS